VITDELQNAVLARFAEELAEADELQLRHLAERAEARYASADFGQQMRALVDHEKAARAFGLTGITDLMFTRGAAR
jgi:hypothetical protein